MKYSEQLTDNIYRIKVPFEDDNTSVFIIKKDDFLIVADAATTKGDVTDYIVPAIEEMGGNIKAVILSHSHGDHAGGCVHLKEVYPDITIYLYNENHAVNKLQKDYIIPKDEEILFDCIKVFNFKGHSSDSLGLMDIRDNTLLTFDCLQLYGVGRYGTGLSDLGAYLSTIDRVGKLDITALITSHDYYPLGSITKGKIEIDKFLKLCVDCIYDYKDFAANCIYDETDKIAADYNAKYPERPTVSKRLFDLIKDYSL